MQRLLGSSERPPQHLHPHPCPPTAGKPSAAALAGYPWRDKQAERHGVNGNTWKASQAEWHGVIGNTPGKLVKQSGMGCVSGPAFEPLFHRKHAGPLRQSVWFNRSRTSGMVCCLHCRASLTTMPYCHIMLRQSGNSPPLKQILQVHFHTQIDKNKGVSSRGFLFIHLCE